MVNTLFLPELREMLAENNTAELTEFCEALHPARTAEFMEGLSADEAWRVLSFADAPTRAEIFSFFEHHKQIEIIESQDRAQIAELIAELAPDDRVDVLSDVEDDVVQELLPLLPADERRDILRLSAYPEGVAGAVMTTEVAKLSENLTVREALDDLRRQAEEYETIYYIYAVDDAGHLRGLVSARQLVSKMGKPDTPLRDLMETELVTAHVLDDQEEVANKVARYDLLAIPVVDDEYRMLGIITHDDVIDVMHEEALEDAHMSAAVAPLDESYLLTHFFTLSWKRGIWLCILFVAALFTAVSLRMYEDRLAEWAWLVAFIPLVISSGGNSGSQSATLIISALSRGHITLRDWWRIMRREFFMGLVLGGMLASFGLIVALFVAPRWHEAFVIPITLLLVVTSGTMFGSMLPLIFHRLGLDPALMSNPFVAAISDNVGIIIYMTVAMVLLTQGG
ncbi:MAG: magnesium transporter [Pirellulaceae bacterium]